MQKDKAEANKMDFAFHPVDGSHWKDFERLFEQKGSPHFCWCMLWRAAPGELKRMENKDRKECMFKRISDGIPVGILGYREGEPVAWCSIAPKSSYRNLTKDTVTPEHDVWSLVCFFVKNEFRKRGLTRLLVEEAVRYAAEQGAKAVEAYPVDPDSPSYRFMGFVSMFESMGFRELGRAGSRRHIMALEIKGR